MPPFDWIFTRSVLPCNLVLVVIPKVFVFYICGIGPFGSLLPLNQWGLRSTMLVESLKLILSLSLIFGVMEVPSGVVRSLSSTLNKIHNGLSLVVMAE